MFSLLAKIINLQTEKIKEVPTRLDKDKMRDFAQLPERYQASTRKEVYIYFTQDFLHEVIKIKVSYFRRHIMDHMLVDTHIYCSI